MATNKFTPGQVLYAAGYSMECKTVCVKVVFIRYTDDSDTCSDMFDCVVESEDVRQYGKSSDLLERPFEVH